MQPSTGDHPDLVRLPADRGYGGFVALWWFYLVYAEFVFVACFVATEALRLTFRMQVNRMDGAVQVIQPEKFFQQVAVPLATAFITGVLMKPRAFAPGSAG